MKHLIKLMIVSCLFTIVTTIQAQSTVSATGGNPSGTGGTVSYSIGQVVYSTNTGPTGTESQGVQQPYEISIVTSIINTEGNIPECTVFPNPTIGSFRLVVKSNDFGNLTFKLYDLNGIKIQDKKIDGEETEILMNSLKPSTYFLKILRGTMEIKTFKIIKN